MIKSIPLTKLVQSPRNVRRHGDPAADSELKASIAAHVSTAEQKSAMRRRKTRPRCYMPGGVA